MDEHLAEGERRLAFDLDMQPEESEPGSLEYTPTDGGTDEATARHLPEYMRDSIVFEAEQGMIDRGADLQLLSQYPHEREILFAPL